MVDSRNARRGADTINSEKIRAELKQKFNRNLLTSEYFQYFDEMCPKNMSTKQNNYLRIAAEVAMNSEMNHKHGAVLVHKKNIFKISCLETIKFFLETRLN